MAIHHADLARSPDLYRSLLDLRPGVPGTARVPAGPVRLGGDYFDPRAQKVRDAGVLFPPPDTACGVPPRPVAGR